jgi:hypothetical protein
MYAVSNAALEEQIAAARASALDLARGLAATAAKKRGMTLGRLVSERRLPLRDRTGAPWRFPKMLGSRQQDVDVDVTATFALERTAR